MYKEFEVRMLNESGKTHATYIATAFADLLKTLLTHNPEPSREMSIVCTKLEEACFFATKAMANQAENIEGQ